MINASINFAFNAFIRAPFTDKSDKSSETEKSKQTTITKVSAYAIAFIFSCVIYSALFSLGYGMSALALGKDSVAVVGNLLTNPNPLMLIVGSLFTLIGITLMGIFNKETPPPKEEVEALPETKEEAKESSLESFKKLEELIEKAELIISYQPSFIFSIPTLLNKGITKKEILKRFNNMNKDTRKFQEKINKALKNPVLKTQEFHKTKERLENIKGTLERLKKTQAKNREKIVKVLERFSKIREESKIEQDRIETLENDLEK